MTDPAMIERAVEAHNRAVIDRLHPETYCHRCGGPNVTWYAPSPLWNAVMGYPDSGWDGIVCMHCFAQIAEAKGIVTAWRLSYADSGAGRPPWGLKAELPTHSVDGRPWNPATDLWEDGDA